MREVVGDLWAAPTTYRVITTNGTVKWNWAAVLGRGCAKEATERYPTLAADLGMLLRQEGNHVHIFPGIRLITFPVKNQWYEKADLSLIHRSVGELERLIRQPHTYTMVRPGCGNGGLTWDQVRPYVNRLPDNVFIINKE